MEFKKHKALLALIVFLFLAAIWQSVYFSVGNISLKVKNFHASKGVEKNLKSGDTGEFYLVKRVIDGDTIELESGERVRYIGIDTPETVDPRKPIQCFGKEASVMNRELVEGKSVRMEKDVSNKDKYGRLLRYVYQGEKFINLELVKNGYAHAYTYPPDVKNSKMFLDAQKFAREALLGLWGACFSQNK